MQLGFSYIGLIWLLMLFIPNFIWMKNKPKGYEEYAKKENKVLVVFERIGQFIVTPAALIFSNFNFHKFTFWSVVLILSFICMVIYEIFWIRYFRSEKTMKDFYRNMFGIAVPGATLPVVAFFLLGIYGGNIIMILGAVVILLLVVVFGFFIYAITGRNINEIKRAFAFKDGINEELYVPLKNGDGFVRLIGKDQNNPVILYLHGGPGEPDGYSDYLCSDGLTDEYTLAVWDESGCGRSYYRNIEKGNAKIPTPQSMQEDIDSLVDYLRGRFNQDKVIIMGHSFGTVLGSTYVSAHPEKVTAFISIGQVVSFKNFASEHYAYADAIAQAKAKGDDTTELEKVYKAFCEDPNVVNMQPLRQATSVYHQETVPHAFSYADLVCSPYLGVDDVRWTLFEYSMMLGNPGFEMSQGELLADLMEFDINEHYKSYEVPVMYISGSADWICPWTMVKEYYESIEAPKKSMYVMEGCGHAPQDQLPDDYVSAVKQFLKSA